MPKVKQWMGDPPVSYDYLIFFYMEFVFPGQKKKIWIYFVLVVEKERNEF